MLFVIPILFVIPMLFVIPAQAGIHKSQRANLNIRNCSSIDISISMNERMGLRLRGDDEGWIPRHPGHCLGPKAGLA